MESGNISPSYQKNAPDPLNPDAAPGMHQDYSTRKLLKKAERNINRNEKWVLASFIIEFIVFVVIIAAWTSLSQIERPTDEAILKQRIEDVKEKVESRIATLKQKTADVQELKRKLAALKQKHNETYGKFEAEMTKINRDTATVKGNILTVTEKITKYKGTMTEIRRCGKTKRMIKKFDVSKDKTSTMQCSENKPCYCYGKICLVPKDKDDCGKGNVFIRGLPMCGSGFQLTPELGKIICQELGFRDFVRREKDNKFGEAIVLNGWIYLNKPFKKEKCNYEDPGNGEIPSIASCIDNPNTGFWYQNSKVDWCTQKSIDQYALGVVCT